MTQPTGTGRWTQFSCLLWYRSCFFFSFSSFQSLRRFIHFLSSQSCRLLDEKEVWTRKCRCVLLLLLLLSLFLAGLLARHNCGRWSTPVGISPLPCHQHGPTSWKDAPNRRARRSSDVATMGGSICHWTYPDPLSLASALDSVNVLVHARRVIHARPFPPLTKSSDILLRPQTRPLFKAIDRADEYYLVLYGTLHISALFTETNRQFFRRKQISVTIFIISSSYANLFNYKFWKFSRQPWLVTSGIFL